MPLRHQLPAVTRVVGDGTGRNVSRMQANLGSTGRQPPALVADDEPQVRRVACSTLNMHSWRTLEAADGVAALPSIRDDEFMAIVLDLIGQFDSPTSPAETPVGRSEA